MRALRRLSNAVALLAVLTLGLTACTPATDTPAPTSTGTGGELQKVTVGLSYVANIQFAPFYVASVRGFFAEQGLDVTLRHHGVQEDLFQALESGEEDMLYASGDEMMVQRGAGHNVVMAAQLYQHYPVSVLVREGEGLFLPADLRGKTIGVPGEYGSTYYGLLALLQRAGLTKNDVNIQTIGFTQANALGTKKVDAVVGFSNNDRYLAEKYPGIKVREIPALDQGAPVLVGPGLIVKGDASVSDEVAQKITRAVLKAEDAIAGDFPPAVEDSKRFVSGLTTEKTVLDAKNVLGYTQRLWNDSQGVPSAKIDTAAFERMSEFFATTGITPTAVDPASAYRLPADEAAPTTPPATMPPPTATATTSPQEADDDKDGPKP